MAEASEQDEIKPEEIKTFLRQYVPEHMLARGRDTLNGRYRIVVNEPLPAFSTTAAKAYAARDSESPTTPLYALVFEANAMPRSKHIPLLKEYRHPNLLALIDDGVAEISLHSESRYVVIMERPLGQSLQSLLSVEQKNPVSELTVANYLLRPFNEILTAFAGMGISHNRINLSNVYIHNSILQLGECVSEPSGYSQDHLFETIDRILTSSWGRPDYAIDADCYALGVLALHLLLGYQPYARVTKEDFVNSMLVKGAYHTLVVPWDISDHFQDLFRALLNDTKRDRCAPGPIHEWLSGRRFNLILPSVNQETSRGFEFAGHTYFNRKSLAHALFLHWDEARSLLFDLRLPRWLETSAHKKDVADAVARISSNTLGDTAKAERQNNELVSRIIITLDPTGPIRFKSLSYTPEGAGTLLAHYYFTGDTEGSSILQQAIEADLAGYWFEQQKTGEDHTSFHARLQKARAFLRMHSTGFGIERCLYDFHPLLPCQSPLVRRLCVLSVQELLYALDGLSSSPKVAEMDFMDTHIAAFLASRLEIGKEIRVTELDAMSHLISNAQLVSIKLLARAQSHAKVASTQGLTHWMMLRVLSLLSIIHRRSIRYKMQKALQQAAHSGKISAVANVLLTPDLFVADFTAFQKAATLYAYRKLQITKLNNPKERSRHARIVGRGLAQTLAYGTSLFTIYFTLRSYYHI